MVKVTNDFGDRYSGKVGDSGVFASIWGIQYRRRFVKLFLTFCCAGVLGLEGLTYRLLYCIPQMLANTPLSPTFPE